MNVTTVRVLVADVGGVLCRFDPAPRLRTLSERTGLPEDVLHTRIFDSGFETSCEAGERTAAEAHAWLVANIDWRGTLEELSEVWMSAFTPDDEVVETMARTGLPLAIFSNNGPLFADFLDVRFPALAARFPRRFFACGLRARKPSVAAFEAVQAALFDELEASAEEIFFVDDSATNTDAARSLGWRAHTFEDVKGLEGALGKV